MLLQLRRSQLWGFLGRLSQGAAPVSGAAGTVGGCCRDPEPTGRSQLSCSVKHARNEKHFIVHHEHMNTLQAHLAWGSFLPSCRSAANSPTHDSVKYLALACTRHLISACLDFYLNTSEDRKPMQERGKTAVCEAVGCVTRFTSHLSCVFASQVLFVKILLSVMTRGIRAWVQPVLQETQARELSNLPYLCLEPRNGVKQFF